MKLLRNRIFAWFIVALLILFSVFFGGCRSLLRERENIQNFYQRGDRETQGLGQLLEQRRLDAAWMLSYCGAIMPATDKLYVAFKQDSAEFVNAETYADKCVANAKLDHSAYDLRGRAAAILKDDDKLEYDNIYNNFIAVSERIESNPYNEIAVRFNARLDSFPGTAAVWLVGLEPLPLFLEIN